MKNSILNKSSFFFKYCKEDTFKIHTQNILILISDQTKNSVKPFTRLAGKSICYDQKAETKLINEWYNRVVSSL